MRKGKVLGSKTAGQNAIVIKMHKELVSFRDSIAYLQCKDSAVKIGVEKAYVHEDGDMWVVQIHLTRSLPLFVGGNINGRIEAGDVATRLGW